MSERNQVYKCAICGAMTEVLQGGGGTLVCCNQPMEPLAVNTTDAATEKHVPVVESVGGKTKVTVGSVAHPMQDEHFIQWIELIDDDRVQRVYLKPGEAPQAFFEMSGEALVAREYCNLHGLWRA